jgi:hypothetical protein
MILGYFTANFMTLMIVSALVVMMIVNRKLKIPATQLFYALIAVVLVLSVFDYLDDFLAGDFDIVPSFDPIAFRTFVDGIIYILRPVVILIELLVILPKPKYRLLCTIPAIINAVIFSTAFFGSKIAFYIDANGWQGGVLRPSVFVVQILYVALLAVCSMAAFGRGNLKRGSIILIMVLMAVLTAILERENIMTGQSTAVAAFCVLLYYIYLASNYQQEIHELFEEKELHIARQELLLLRSQINSDFIFDTLSIIRSLAKTDKKASATAIDSFSLYLRSHLNAIQNDRPIAFQQEEELLNAYLKLLQIGKKKSMELVCDLQDTEFELPPLLLESVADYCIRQDSGNNSMLFLKTGEEGKQIHILVSLNESPPPKGDPAIAKELETAESRLKLQCGGTLRTDGASVSIMIPKMVIA